MSQFGYLIVDPGALLVTDKEWGIPNKEWGFYIANLSGEINTGTAKIMKYLLLFNYSIIFIIIWFFSTNLRKIFRVTWNYVRKKVH